MKHAKQIPSLAALAAAVVGFAAPQDPIRVLAGLTFAGVAILLWLLPLNQPTQT